MSYGPWDSYDAIRRIIEDQERLRHMSDPSDAVRRTMEDQERLRRIFEPSDAVRTVQQSVDDKLSLMAQDVLGLSQTHREAVAKLAATGSLAREYLAEIERVLQHNSVTADAITRQYALDANALEATRLMLAQAVLPLPAFDLSALSRTYSFDFASLEAAIARINAAIDGATYLGEADYLPQEEGDDEDGEHAQGGEPETVIEDQLIEIVPIAVLDQLRRVEFVPIKMLDQMLRSPNAMRLLTGRDFERFVATLVDELGFEDVVLTPRSSDNGRDVLARKTLHGISMLFAFECKRYHPDRPVGPDILRALLGTITHGSTKANKGVLVTTSTFTSGARKFILTEPSIDGKDFDAIIGWLKERARQH
jgi:hypothetical protein